MKEATARDRPAPAAEPPAPIDRFIDQMVADELDWRLWVERYPKSALTLAALGGFVLGRERGREIVVALGAYAADTLAEGINEFLGRKLV